MAERQPAFNSGAGASAAESDAVALPTKGAPVLLSLFLLFCLTAFSWQGGIGATDTAGISLADRESAGRGYVAGFLYLIALAGVMTGPAAMIRLGFRMWPHTLFVLFALASAAWSSNPARVVIFVGNFCGVWLLAVATATRWSISRDRLYIAIHWTLMVYLIASVLVVLLLPNIGLRQIADTTGAEVARWQGFASHPNTLGSSTVLLIWVALSLRLTGRHRLMSIISNITIPLALAIVLFGARSMTAAAADIAMIATYLLLPKGRSLTRASNRRFVLMAALTLGALFTALLSLVFLDFTGPHGSIQFAGRDLTFSGRVALWDVGWMAFTAKPLAGWSFDYMASFLEATNGYMKTGHFHNGWINILVLGGLTGFLLTSGMIIRFIRVTLRLSKTHPVSARSSAIFFVAFMLENLGETQLCEVSHALWGIFLVLWAMNEYQVLSLSAAIPRARALTTVRPFPSQTG